MASLPTKWAMKRYTFAALTLTSLLTVPPVVTAETATTSEWNITADRIIRFEDPQSVIAEGNIILEKRQLIPQSLSTKPAQATRWDELLGTQTDPPAVSGDEVTGMTANQDQYHIAVTIKADWMAYDVTNQSIKARGNVQVLRKEDTLAASMAKVDLNSETGSFQDAVIIRKEGELHLEGKSIEKTGINTYRIQNGWVVTCKVDEGETPPWSFASADTTIKQEGYAVLKHARFRIKNIPVFYTPYMILPVKTERQTGLLLPEFSSSENSGFSFNLPFYWVLSDSMDVTLFPELYEKRGFMPGIEFRYVTSEENKGAFMASYLHDNLTDPSETAYYADTGFTHTNQDRYWIRGKADHNFGLWQTRLDIDLVSDRDYLTEFNSGYTGLSGTNGRFKEMFGRGFDNKTDDTRENSFRVLRSWNNIFLEGDILAINDVRETKSSPTPLWKLPSLGFSGIIPLWQTGISLNWNNEYVNYYREDGVGAHRFDIHPSLSTNLPLPSFLESRAELGVRDTLYMVEEYGDGVWTNDDDQNRFTADFELEVASTFMRHFNFHGENVTGLDHQIRPFIRYSFIPEVDQDELPTFDDQDFIDETNSITYGIDNFFDLYTNRGWRDYGYLKISQSYEFKDEASDEPLSDLLIRLGINPLASLHFEYETEIDMYGDGFVRHSVEGEYTNSRGDLFSLEYSFNEPEEIEQINAQMQTSIGSRWSTTVEVVHSIEFDETIEANFSLGYTADCWGLEFQSKYSPEDTRFMILFNLANIGTPFGLNL